jgi:hypothetical protein
VTKTISCDSSFRGVSRVYRNPHPAIKNPDIRVNPTQVMEQRLAKAFDCKVALQLVQERKGYRKRQWRDRYGAEWAAFKEKLKQDRFFNAI